MMLIAAGDAHDAGDWTPVADARDARVGLGITGKWLLMLIMLGGWLRDCWKVVLLMLMMVGTGFGIAG